MSRKVVLAFDLYGTLLSTSSISKELAKYFGDEAADKIAALARTLQLEYTWRLNSMRAFVPFSTITQRSLNHALRANGKSLDEPAMESLMQAYDGLSTFDDVPAALKTLALDPDIHSVVFSNGTKDMVSSSVYNSADLSPHSSVFKDIVTVEEAKCYKPAPEVYRYLMKNLGKEENPEETWLISGNPFDVVGARSVGMQAAWVDREGTGWQDELIEGALGQPTIVVRDLREVVKRVQEWNENRHS